MDQGYRQKNLIARPKDPKTRGNRYGDGTRHKNVATVATSSVAAKSNYSLRGGSRSK